MSNIKKRTKYVFSSNLKFSRHFHSKFQFQLGFESQSNVALPNEQSKRVDK